jgi:hypothetical protein
MPLPCNEVERAERSGGLHKRSAEDWGDGLYAREGGALLGIQEISASPKFGLDRMSISLRFEPCNGKSLTKVGTISGRLRELFPVCP